VTTQSTTKIRNIAEAARVGDREGRAIVLRIAEQTLRDLDSYHRLRDITSYEDGILTIGARSWDLTKKRGVYLVGAGKACNAMAMAIDHVLGERLTAGVAIVKVAEPKDNFLKTEMYVGGHPLPNEEGHRATRRILDLVDQSGPDDLFIVVISGGSSALMNYPIEGISVAEEAQATDLLLKSGAGIFEVNAVRRHISQVNGGRLAQRIGDRGAELIGIGISDAVSRPPTRDIGVPVVDYNSTPIGPDQTTLDDARRVVHKYGLRGRLPASVTSFLDGAGPENETPKAFPENTYFLVNTLPDSAARAKWVAESMGLQAQVLTTFLEGESRESGVFFASLARQIRAPGSPFAPPCVLISAGETTTRIDHDDHIAGHGGPSHELTAGFALTAAHAPGSVMFSIDTEGTDGTANAAGGITDSTSLSRAREAGVDLMTALRTHATYEALSAIGDVVITGNTGTNLCDLNILFVPGTDEEAGDA
jgi:glycerate 2-kinase